VASDLLPSSWINGLLAVIFLLLLATLVNRVRQGLAEVAQTSQSE
jgi:CDP-diacylglycerol--glycerol-3-phosphate 3-phosphatidyltransferase